MEMTKTIITHSPEETIALGERIGALLRGGEVIAYRGGLGAGKTTITRGISLGMGLATDPGLYIGFVMMLAITMVAAPGVPGGAIMASLGLLGSMLGFDANMQGLMIALYIAMDSFGTAGNVTGDGAIALIMDRIASKVKVRVPAEPVPMEE